MARQFQMAKQTLWPRTVRARATAVVTLIAAVVLALGSIGLSVTLRRILLDDTAERTALAARKVVVQIGAAALPRHLPEPGGGADAVVVLDARGRALAGTGPDPDATAAPFKDLRPGPDEDSAKRIVSVPSRDSGGRDLVVVMTAPTAHGDQYVYAITQLEELDEGTRALGAALLAGSGLVIMLTAALTWTVTGVALRPVTAIRRELASVTASELSRRVPDPAAGDEVSKLARTVNATLARLEESVARQRQFVADASHELRSPIATVRAELEVAVLEARDDTTKSSVRQALAATERLQLIATDLLFLARLDARAATVGRPLDLALIAEEEAARRIAARVPVTADAGTPVPMHGDQIQLERLLTNLVDNAVRHAATEVRIRARAEEGGRWAVLEVIDDGPGIPPEAVDRIFERFVRLEDDRNRHSGGSGLGLAIAREIARVHGGSLTVEPSGSGARLVARFPVGSEDRPGRS